MEKEKSLNQVAKMAKSNHIWLNAFNCINPSDKFLISLGKEIMAKLDNKECLLKTDTLSEMLYLSINKS